MAKTQSVVTNNANVVPVSNQTEVEKQLAAKLLEMQELRAKLEAMEKETHTVRLGELDKFRQAAKNAIQQFRLLASAGEVAVLHAELFPRQKSDKPRKPRAKKVTTETK